MSSSRIAAVVGNGATLSYVASSGGSAVNLGGVKSVTFGGYSEEFIDETDLSNTSVMTKCAGGLKEISDVTVSLKALGAASLPAGNAQWTLTLPNSHGSYVFFGQISGGGDMTVEPRSAVDREITITPTNLGFDGAETAPVLTLQ